MLRVIRTRSGVLLLFLGPRLGEGESLRKAEIVAHLCDKTSRLCETTPRLGRGLELARQVSWVTASADQVNNLPPELRQARWMSWA